MLEVVDGVVLMSGILLLALLGSVACRGLGLSYRAFTIPASIGLALGLLLHGFETPLMISTSDSSYYLRWAEEIAISWESDEVSSRAIWPGRGVFAVILAYFGLVLTAPQFGAIVLNSFFMGLIVVLLVSIQETLGGSRRPNWAILLFLTMPGVLLFGPAPLRESIYWFGVTLGAWALSKLSQRALWAAGVSLGGAIAVIMLIRPDAGLVVSYGLIFLSLGFLVFATKRIAIAVKLAGIAVAGFLAVVFRPLLYFVRPGVEDENHLVAVRNSLAKDSQTTGFLSAREGSDSFFLSAREGSGSFLCDYPAWGQFLCDFPANFLSATFGPFVSEIGDEAIWIPVVASTVHLLGVFFLSLIGLYKGKEKTLILALIALALLTQAMHAAILTNYGLLMRFKPVTEILLIPVAASVISQLFQRTKVK